MGPLLKTYALSGEIALLGLPPCQLWTFTVISRWSELVLSTRHTLSLDPALQVSAGRCLSWEDHLEEEASWGGWAQ